MILILTKSDLAPPAPITEEQAALVGIPFTQGHKTLSLKKPAQQAALLAETVWFRDDEGKIVVAKSRVNTPIGTQVTLFNTAELFGIKLDKST